MRTAQKPLFLFNFISVYIVVTCIRIAILRSFSRYLFFPFALAEDKQEGKTGIESPSSQSCASVSQRLGYSEEVNVT